MSGQRNDQAAATTEERVLRVRKGSSVPAAWRFKQLLGREVDLLGEVDVILAERELSEDEQVQAALDVLARVPHESGVELGELIEERRGSIYRV